MAAGYLPSRVMTHRVSGPIAWTGRLISIFRFSPGKQHSLVVECTQVQLHKGRDYANTTSNYPVRSEEHTSELQSRGHLVCRLLLEKKKSINKVCKRVLC